MNRPSPDVTLIAACAIADAYREAHAAFWRRRADELEAARPQPGDFTGAADPHDLNDHWNRLTEAARACRNRAVTPHLADLDLAEAAGSITSRQVDLLVAEDELAEALERPDIVAIARLEFVIDQLAPTITSYDADEAA